LAAKLIVLEFIDLPLLLPVHFLASEILAGGNMGSRSCLVVNHTISTFFYRLWRFDTSAHIIIYLVPFVFAAFELLLENILSRAIFSCILGLHVLHVVVIVHVAHESHVVASSEGLALVLLMLITLDQGLLQLVVPVLQALDLHLLRLDLRVQHRDTLVHLVLHLLLVIT